MILLQYRELAVCFIRRNSDFIINICFQMIEKTMKINTINVYASFLCIYIGNNFIFVYIIIVFLSNLHLFVYSERNNYGPLANCNQIQKILLYFNKGKWNIKYYTPYYVK